jgi:hypothetical protein
MQQLIDQAISVFVGLCIPEVSGGAIKHQMSLDQFQKASPEERQRQDANDHEDLFLIGASNPRAIWLSMEGPYCRVYSEAGDKIEVREKLAASLTRYGAELERIDDSQADIWRGSVTLTELDTVNVVLSQRAGNAEGFHMSAFRSRHSPR